MGDIGWSCSVRTKSLHPVLPCLFADQAVSAAARRQCSDLQNRQISPGDLQHQLPTDRRNEFRHIPDWDDKGTSATDHAVLVIVVELYGSVIIIEAAGLKQQRQAIDSD